MSIRNLKYTVTGTKPLLLSNPQTVDKFNPIARKMKTINDKGRRRTDDDYLELRDLEMEAKIYWDDELGVYIPTTWILAALCKVSFSQAKIAKADIRGAVFSVESRLPLNYAGKKKVKGVEDVTKNGDFRQMMLLKQGQVKIAKTAPVFHDWSFTGHLEFDDKIIDPDTIEHLLDYASHYGGFGDFRPTFGRAEVVVEHA